MRVSNPSFAATLLASATLTLSAPKYYSFEGKVTWSQNVPSQPYGSTVTYVFKVDKARDGYEDIAEYGGPLIRSTLQDYSADGSSFDYFYSQYLGGSGITVDNPTSTTYDAHYGLDWSGGFVMSIISGSNSDVSGSDYIQVVARGRNIDQWAVGQSDFTGGNYVNGAPFRGVESNLTLTAISTINPFGPENTDPVADAGANLTLASSQAAAAVLAGSASDADEGAVLSCRWTEGDLVLKDWAPVAADGACPLSLYGLSLSLGQHTLTLEVTDGTATASDAMLLSLENTAPTAVASGAGSYEAGSSIALGGELSDFDGDLLHYEWIVGGSTICTGDLAAPAGGAPVAFGACSAEGLALGNHVAVLRVFDGTNAPVEVSVSLELVDTSLPTLAPAASAQILWPPDHRMVDIEILSNAADNSGAVALSASVSSNEAQNGLGDGDLAVDWDAITIDPATGKIALKLRAERSGKGIGRVYSVTVTAKDPAGNTATAVIEVKVPHSQTRK